MLNKTKQLFLLLTVTMMLPASVAWSENLVLRERATVNGPVIRLGDVADISARSTATLKDLVTTPLFPSPAPGTQQFLQRSQVLDLLMARGINVENLQVRGAKVVEIGSLAETRATQKKTGTKPNFGRSLLETEEAVEAAVAQYMAEHTSHQQWDVEVILENVDLEKIASWGSNFLVHGAKRPRMGSQRFRIATDGSKETVSFLANVTQVHSLVFARRAIVRGSLVRATDVEIRQHEGSAPSLALRDLEQVVGMEAKRSIPLNTILSEGAISAPLQVKRGETVTVYARTGGVTVRTMAIARQDGAMGDLVQVESVNGKQTYVASVSGSRRLDVYPTGASTEDFAAIGKKNSPRR